MSKFIKKVIDKPVYELPRDFYSVEDRYERPFYPTQKTRPKFGCLQKLRVIDSGVYVIAPWAAKVMADWGADVIMVERPGGDPQRYSLPIIVDKETRLSVSTYFIAVGRNKRSIALNLKTEKGKEVFLKLLKTADIWLESSIPGAYQKIGITDDLILKINPRLVIVHVSTYGQYGHPTCIGRAGYDAVAQAFGTLMSTTGEPYPRPPMRAGNFIGDYITAWVALASALAAYIYAQETGKGQVIEVTQYESVFSTASEWVNIYFKLGIPSYRTGNAAIVFAPYNLYKCKDGWVFIGAGTDGPFKRLTEMIGKPELAEDPRFKDITARFMNQDALDRIINEWTSKRTKKEINELALNHQVPCGSVYDTKDAANDPHYAARGSIVEWEDPVAGKVKGPDVIPKFSLTPGSIWRGAPLLGQDTEEILTELGYSKEEIEKMEEEGVIHRVRIGGN